MSAFPVQDDRQRTATALILLALFAWLVRWFAYTGFFGSDGVTYIASAFKLLDGDWRVDDYVGANRLGVNLPMAAFAAVLGRHEWAVALYAMLCSVGEVVLVAWFGVRVFGMRAGILAGLLMATLPTHVHYAGRMMADSPLALTITASFVCFFVADRSRSSIGYFWAGVLAGLSFWIKPVTMFVFGILFAYPLLARRLDLRWAWMAAGTAVSILANCLVFWALTGRFWFIFESILRRRQSGYLEAGASAGTIASDPWMYFEYLFLKVYHTGLIGFLALGGLLVWWAGRRAKPDLQADQGRVVFWAIGLLAILSWLPVRFDPVVFVPKQANYMLIFVAPLCLLGGHFLARLSTAHARALALLASLVGIGFALLLQASVAVFTANSWHTLEAVQGLTADSRTAVMSNTWRAAQFKHLFGGTDLRPRLAIFDDIDAGTAPPVRYAVINVETFDWDTDRPFDKLADVPKCWTFQENLQGQPQGPGVALAGVVLEAVEAVPPLATSAVARKLRSLVEPRPARLYRVPGPC